MLKLLIHFYWYILGRIIAQYYNRLTGVEYTCNWCGYSLEELGSIGDHLIKILNSGTSYNGEYHTYWNELLITCPQCYHETLINDSSP